MLATIAYFFRWLLRTIFGYLNALVYWVDAELYDLMMDIAGAKVFKQETIMTVSGRIYQLLGLIMLFKLIFSFITYVINPDEMTDKNKGYSNLIKKIIISLCLIVITPWAFTQSRNLQIYIIEDKVIEYFVFGQTMPSNATAGNNFMNTVSTLVMQPYECADNTCSALYSQNLKERKLCDSDWIHNLAYINDDGTVKAAPTNVGKCGYGAGSDKGYALALKKSASLSANGSYDFTARMTLGMYGKQTDGGWNSDFFVNDQLFFLGSSLIGIMIGYMLIVMCIDVALRSIKLAFYEIIAPIPIISYVGFKDGKDSMLNKWFGEVVKTYADLFTRIAGLQLSIFFINLIMDDGVVVNGDGAVNTIFVNLFLLFGALTFAKQLPKILEGMGIKFSGGGFNLKKKFTDDMVGGKKLWAAGKGMTLGLAGGMAANALKGGANFFKDRKANHELKKEMRAAGYKGLMTRAKRNEFYKNNESMRDLGSVRHRRDYARQAARDNYRQANSQKILDRGQARVDQLTHQKNALENTANQREQAKIDKKAQLMARGMSEAQAIASKEYQDLQNSYLAARSASDAFNSSYSSKVAEIQNRAINDAIKEQNKKGPGIGGRLAGNKAAAEFTRDNASEFTGGLGSVIAGGVSAAVHTVTSKDGKVSEGIKTAVDNRDLRDKRQSADYGFFTRVGDSVAGFAGLDTVAKTKANELHDEINELQLRASAAQKRYTDAVDDAARNAAMAEYQAMQTKITKTQKKLEKLYESSKK